MTASWPRAPVQKRLAETTAKDKLKQMGKQDCKLNAHYKRVWCVYLGDTTKQTASECFASPTTLPRVVLEGGVGD